VELSYEGIAVGMNLGLKVEDWDGDNGVTIGQSSNKLSNTLK